MRTEQTEAERADHARLRDHVEHIRLAAREIPRVSPDERHEIVARILEFLRDTLLIHAEAEERQLYPAVAKLLGHPEATAPMVRDHVAIRARIVELGATDDSDVDRLQELLYSLYTLISVHFWKEEQLYLPLVEHVQPVWDE